MHLYYVDGGSTDKSVSIAENCNGVTTIVLHPEFPAPGLERNRGWQDGNSSLVQFLDSDTTLDPDWFLKATAALQQPGVGAVRGNRIEMFPEASVYNWLGNLEWNAPPGECDSFGGDVMIHRSVLEETGGYDEELVGGEDPELSQRLRVRQYKIIQLDAAMTHHDLAMTRVSQYWRRAYRTGYGFAAVSRRVAKTEPQVGGFWQYELKRILVRGGIGGMLALFGLLGATVIPWSLIGLAIGLFLILYPRMFRIRYFMQSKNLARDKARVYAWHCSLVVIPEIFGIARFYWGELTGKPLRNKVSRLRTDISKPISSLILLILFCLSACSSIDLEKQAHTYEGELNRNQIIENNFSTEPKKTKDFFASHNVINSVLVDISNEYLLGPGDKLRLNVWNRPEISTPTVTVGPDGIITVNRIGFVNVDSRTRAQVADEIQKRLAKLYEKPEVSLEVVEYTNNKAFVLGRVANPGVVSFSGKGTLLEALSMAGGLSAFEEQASKCAIIRGKDKIIWIDLNELLNNGNMALNARIINNDVIFIPESEDEMIYVMGEVARPGAFRLKGSLTFMDALMMAGGPTKNANLEKNYVIRSFDGKGVAVNIDMKKMLTSGDFSKNFLLKDNDIIFIAETGLSKFNYTLDQILPFLKVLDLSTSTLERFGVMPEVRKKLWGQEGFVGN